MSVIGLRIEDPGLSSRIEFVLKNKGYETVSLEKGDRASSPVIVITDTDPDFSHEKTLRLTDDTTEEDLLWQIRVLERLPDRMARLVIGVDPGKKVGAAALVDTSLIATLVTNKPGELRRWIGRVRELVDVDSFTIRIGRGERWQRILTELEEVEAAEIEVTDEKYTTKKARHWKDKRFEKDVAAALRIALKK